MARVALAAAAVVGFSGLAACAHHGFLPKDGGRGQRDRR